MRRKLTAEELAAQLDLFAGLDVACAPEPSRSALLVADPPARLSVEARPLPDWVDPDDIPEEGDYPVHAVVSAADCSMPKTKAASSIWDLGAACAAKQVIREVMRQQAEGDPEIDFVPPADTIHRRITREAGITRHISMRYQETEEWAEKERIRRAKQVLPKPPKQTFRLRSKAAV